MSDDEVGVLFAHFGPADAHALEAGLVDQGAGAKVRADF